MRPRPVEGGPRAGWLGSPPVPNPRRSGALLAPVRDFPRSRNRATPPQRQRTARPCRCPAAGAPQPLDPLETRNRAGARQGAASPVDEWASDHLASWEVWPLRQGYRGKTIQTGWTVELLARCPRLREATDVADRLLSIARDVLPRDTAGVAACALPYDGSLRIGPGAAGTPEVRVTIEVIRRADCPGLSDGVARHAVSEIERRLRNLGLRKRH